MLMYYQSNFSVITVNQNGYVSCRTHIYFVAFRFRHKVGHYNPFNHKQSARVIEETSHKGKGKTCNST